MFDLFENESVDADVDLDDQFGFSLDAGPAAKEPNKGIRPVDPVVALPTDAADCHLAMEVTDEQKHAPR